MRTMKKIKGRYRPFRNLFGLRHYVRTCAKQKDEFGEACQAWLKNKGLVK